MFTGFTRDLAPGLRVGKGATVMLDHVKFRNMEELKKSRGTVIEASAIAAYPSATLSLVVRPPIISPTANPWQLCVARTSVILNATGCKYLPLQWRT